MFTNSFFLNVWRFFVVIPWSFSTKVVVFCDHGELYICDCRPAVLYRAADRWQGSCPLSLKGSCLPDSKRLHVVHCMFRSLRKTSTEYYMSWHAQGPLGGKGGHRWGPQTQCARTHVRAHARMHRVTGTVFMGPSAHRIINMCSWAH